MTKKPINPLDKVVGLHITGIDDDGLIINMKRREAMKYIQTLEEIKGCDNIENVAVIVTSHNGFVSEFEAQNIESMEVIPYDTIK